MTDRNVTELARLLKSLGPGAELDGRDAGRLVLKVRAGDVTVSPGLLASAARAGLVTRQGRRLMPTPEAASFLKRQAAAAEEFAGQHRDLEYAGRRVNDVEQIVCINRAESPLAALERLKGRDGAPYFPNEALAAGERLASDFDRGGLQPRLTMRYEPRLGSAVKGGRGGIADLSDTAVAARMRVGHAVDAMGPDLSGVALDVCCFMKGLETVERERQWPARSAKLMLKTALLALHRHYAPPSRGGPRHWGDDDFRPDMRGHNP